MNLLTHVKEILYRNSNQRSRDESLACTWSMRALGAIIYEFKFKETTHLAKEEKLLDLVCKLCIASPKHQLQGSLQQSNDTAVKLLCSFLEKNPSLSLTLCCRGLRIIVAALQMLRLLVPRHYCHKGTKSHLEALWTCTNIPPARDTLKDFSIGGIKDHDFFFASLCGRDLPLRLQRLLARNQPKRKVLLYITSDRTDNARRFRDDLIDCLNSAHLDHPPSRSEWFEMAGFQPHIASLLSEVFAVIQDHQLATELDVLRFSDILISQTVTTNDSGSPNESLGNLPVGEEKKLTLSSGESQLEQFLSCSRLRCCR